MFHSPLAAFVLFLWVNSVAFVLYIQNLVLFQKEKSKSVFSFFENFVNKKAGDKTIIETVQQKFVLN